MVIDSKSVALARQKICVTGNAQSHTRQCHYANASTGKLSDLPDKRTLILSIFKISFKVKGNRHERAVYVVFAYQKTISAYILSCMIPNLKWDLTTELQITVTFNIQCVPGESGLSKK